MNSAEHLLILTPGFPADAQDETCVPPLQMLIPALRAQAPALRITVITLHYPAQAGAYTWQGIPVHALGGDNVRFPQRLGLWRRCLRLARRLHREAPFTHIHSLWLQEATWLGARIARRLGLPLVATQMGQDAQPGNRYLRWIPKRGLRLVAISDRAAQSLKTLYGRSVQAVLPWGIDAAALPDRRAPWARSIDILCAGSLIPLKNYAALFPVIRALPPRERPWRIVIAGAGPELEALQAEAGKLDPALAQVQFAGWLPRQEVLRRMGDARVFFHPARYEGQGLVFEEAQAMGCLLVTGEAGTAMAAPHWRVCVQEADFAEAVKSLLTEEIEFPAPGFYRIEDTAEAYLKLYRLP